MYHLTTQEKEKIESKTIEQLSDTWKILKCAKDKTKVPEELERIESLMSNIIKRKSFLIDKDVKERALKLEHNKEIVE